MKPSRPVLVMLPRSFLLFALCLCLSSIALATNTLYPFLQSGTILIDSTPQPLNGPITVSESYQYNLSLSFSEDAEGQQFGAEKTYTFPTGFSAADDEGTLIINVLDGQQHYEVIADYSIHNNELRVSADPTKNTLEAWNALFSASNTEFRISLYGSFHAGVTEMAWGPAIHSQVTVQPLPPGNHDLQITKKGQFKSDGQIHYSLDITSIGTNSGVVITDQLIGTALSLQPANGITATLGNPPIPANGNATLTSDGFTYALPHMQNGDTLHLAYTAQVDFLGLTGWGTEAETKNTASAKSTEHPQLVTASTSFQNKILYSSLRKRSLSVQESTPGRWTVQWEIWANEDGLVSMDGQTISDTIDPGSRNQMSYTGQGLRVEVMDSSGTPVRNEIIPWTDLHAYSQSSWTYAVPASDTAPYKYHLTYATEIDGTDLLWKTDFKNRATSSLGGGWNASVSITPGALQKINIAKRALSISEDRIDWEIVLIIPASGLNSASFADLLPTQSANGVQMTDEYIEGSLTVDGLLAEESFDGPISSTVANRKRVTVTFYQDAAKTAPGLIGTGALRRIIIHLSTRVHPDWLAMSDSNPRVLAHVNRAELTANGTTLGYNSKNGFPTQKSVTKTATRIGDAPDGMPLFHYTVTIKGLNQLEREDLVIEDVFDTSLLEWAGESVPYTERGQNLANHLQYKNAEVNYALSNQPLTITPTQTGIHLSMRYDDLPKVRYTYLSQPASQSFPENASFEAPYATYVAHYLLKVKDRQALDQIKTLAIASESGTVALSNTASVAQMGAASTTAIYEYNPMIKRLVETVIPRTDARPYAVYELVVNPRARDLDPSSDRLTLTDTLSPSLIVDTDSIEIDPPSQSTLDLEGQDMIFQIPDETSVTITYRAFILGMGNVMIQNTANLLNYTLQTPANEVTVGFSGGGSAQVYSINIYKHKNHNLLTPIQGAVFALFAKDPVTGSWYQKTNHANQPIQFVTGPDGHILIRGDMDSDGWTLIKGKEYYLQEISPPYGYESDDTKHYFRFGDYPDYSKNIYINGDTLRIENSPYTVAYTPKIQKIILGENAPDETFTFQLTPTGATILPDGYARTAHAKSGEIASFETLTFTQAGTYTYTLEEVRPQIPTLYMQYSSTPVMLAILVTADPVTGELFAQASYDGQDSATITNVYSKPNPITYTPTITKTLIGDPAPEETFAFQIAGTGSTTLPAGYAANATAKAGQNATFPPLSFSDVGTYTYAITEVKPNQPTPYMTYSDETIALIVTVTYNQTSKKLEYTATYDGHDSGTFTNRYDAPPPPNEFYFTFTKEWIGGVEGDIVFTLYNEDGTEHPHDFKKMKINEREWRYECWLSSAQDYYVIETPMKGYKTSYRNTGVHSGVTDRCTHGGKIVNYLIPQTGDMAHPAFWLSLLAGGLSGLGVLAWQAKGKKRR